MNLSKLFSPFANSLSISNPVVTSLPFVANPKSFAIESAVKGWSPVIINTLIPASRHSLIEEIASFLIGSMKASIPLYVKFFKSEAVYSLFLGTRPEARAIILKPSFAKASFCLFKFFSSTLSQKEQTVSKEPFTVA